ncbi:MAG: hypothetical protein AAGA02_06580 [Bacteroidota bacterium]
MSYTASAQYYLQLKKRNKVIHTYSAGDRIRFKLQGDDFYTDQMITGVTDSTIRFRLSDVAIRDIKVVKLLKRDSYGLDLVSGAAVTAGIFFLAIDQVNQLFVQDEGLGPSSETLIISGSLVSAGLIIWLLKKKRFRLKVGKYRLSTTDFYVQGS